jgi:hypothetical protein
MTYYDDLAVLRDESTSADRPSAAGTRTLSSLDINHLTQTFYQLHNISVLKFTMFHLPLT